MWGLNEIIRMNNDAVEQRANVKAGMILQSHGTPEQDEPEIEEMTDLQFWNRLTVLRYGRKWTYEETRKWFKKNYGWPYEYFEERSRKLDNTDF